MVSADRTSAGTWGNVPYPVEYVYDSFGRRTEMRTFRADLGWTSPTWPSGSDVAADVTEWVYDEATGLLTDKLDAAGLGPSYTYGPAGRLATRTWARTQADNVTPLVTSYVYDQATGELLGVDYNDATPDVAYSYDRLGRQETVTDAVGVRTFSYDPNTLQLVSEEIDGQGSFDGFYEVTLARKYEDATTGVPGRSAGLQVGDGTAYDVTYGYDARGRFESVSWAAGGSSDVATYGYVPNSDLLSGMTTSSGQSTVYGYEAQRDLKILVRNSFGGTEVSRYEYRYDPLGRRRDVVTSGSAFGDAGNEELSLWSYNDRNEVTGSNRHAGTNPDAPGTEVGDEARSYTYDPIGNRETADQWDGDSAPLVHFDYTADELNQYASIDADGALREPNHDEDGNMEADGSGRTLSYNGENRLVGFDDGSTTASYVYDYIGRRVMKSVGTETRVYLYDGWNMIREDVDPDGAGPAAPVSTHSVWGLDLSQSMQGAGGIGGLVAVVDGSGAASLFAFDGNGNVSELVAAATSSVSAHYEYDAFGNVVTPVVGAAAVNPWRFSTKYVDGESGYSYYGYRYYWGQAGRWMKRDPIDELGSRMRHGPLDRPRAPSSVPTASVNLPPKDPNTLPVEDVLSYVFVGNRPTSTWDLLGLRGCGWLEYNGNTLRWYEAAYKRRDNLRKAITAVTGHADYNAQTDVPDFGAIPAGEYFLLIRWLGMAKLNSDGQMEPGFGMQEVPPRWRAAWGRYRARLQKRERTKTFGRSGFYIHTSEKGQTSGCIETLGDESLLLELRDLGRKVKQTRVPVLVVAAPGAYYGSP